MRRFRRLKLMGLGVLSAVLVFGVAGGMATPGNPNHGVAFSKGCKSPLRVGDQNLCSYTIDNTSGGLNSVNESHDSWTINSIVDVVHAAGGDVSLGDILPSLTLHFTGGASCNGGQTSCTLPFGSTITSDLFSIHQINQADFNQFPTHRIGDNFDLSWHDNCDGIVPGVGDGSPGGGNCDPTDPFQVATTTGSALIVDANVQITPNGTNKVGDTHTFTGHANISCQPASATCVNGFQNAPAGTLITFSEVSDTATSSFVGGVNTCTTIGTTGECTVQISSPTTGVTVVRAAISVSFGTGANLVTVNRATGDGNPGDGPDATKAWVDARITIQQTGTNRVGDPHTFTVTVEANGGTGWAPAAGVAITSTETGVGSITGGTCGAPATGPTDAAGQCTIVVSSTVPGTSTVDASGTVTVGGVAIGVATNGHGAHDIGNAKLWIVTHVRDKATNADITGTEIPAPATVYDEFLASPETQGVAVTFDLYNNGTCNGAVIQTSNGVIDATGRAASATSAPLGAGSYSYLAHFPGGGAPSFPARDAACEPFTVKAASGLITETNVSCDDVLSGAASNFVIGQINYPNTRGRIGQGINPGKFFFWSKITTTVPNQVVTVTQSKTGTNAALFQVHMDWARVYTGNCQTWTTGTQINGSSGASFTIPTPGAYVIGIKYDPKSIVGAFVPTPPTVTYTFTTSLGGNTGASVLLGPK